MQTRIDPFGFLRSRNALTVAAVCLTGFLAQLAFIWPGIADYDTVDIYGEIQSGEVGDWHPPVFARLWQLFLSLGLGGTGPLYCLQLAMFWGGVGLWTVGFARIAKPAVASGLLLAVLLTPAIGFEQVVYKDSHLASALMLATGICVWFWVDGRALPWFATTGVAILLTYAQLLRANGVFCVLPLAVMLAVTSNAGTWHWGRAVGVALASSALLLAMPSINEQIFRAVEEHPANQIALYDSAGVAHFGQLRSMPGTTSEEWSRAEAKNCYQAFYWDTYNVPDACQWIGNELLDRPDIWTNWTDAVVAHPLAYLRHRFGHWNATMRLFVAKREPRGAVQANSQPNSDDLGANEKWLALLTHRLQKGLAATPLYWPAVWYAIGFGMLWAAQSMAQGPSRRLVWCLLPSSLLLSSSFAVVSISSDLRYHLWSMLAAALASALIVTDRSTSRKRLQLVVAIAVLVAAVGIAGRIMIAPDWPEG